LPADRSIDHWAAAIDVDGEPCADDLRALAPLRRAYNEPSVDWMDGATEGGRREVRAAYRVRLASCPGVVLTTTAGVDVSLRCVAWRPSVPMPTAVARAVADLEGAWRLPDGTEIVSSLEYARHASTLPLGFYQRWAPDSVDDAWLARRTAWARCVRNAVLYQGHRYQTPSAYVAAAERGDLSGSSAETTYLAWAAVEDDEGPRSETVWVEGGLDYVGDVLAEYRGRGGGNLVWVRTPALGEAVATLLDRSGVRPVTYHGAGSSPPTGGPAIASYRVHGTGWSGAPAAGYSRALVLEPPSSGATWEQLLGRLHRAGQREDVEVHVLTNTQRGYQTIASGIADATFVEETTGAAQRLLLADWVGYNAPRGPR
jgi:hypothetical protein